MIGDAVRLDTLVALVSQHAVTEAVLGRMVHDYRKWTLSVRLGGPTPSLIPMRSRRESWRA